jgi:hypothetical protein
VRQDAFTYFLEEDMVRFWFFLEGRVTIGSALLVPRLLKINFHEYHGLTGGGGA